MGPVAKNLYVIARCNGAGKTTFAHEFLPLFAHCDEFVNADLIAKGLSPFDPRKASVMAGRLMLQKIHALAKEGKDFGFETTLSGKSYIAFFKEMKVRGYKIHLFYLWLPNVSMAINRVQDRVRLGGHSIPEFDIRRRFKRSIRHVLYDYKALLDSCILFDNSGDQPKKIAMRNAQQEEITDPALYRKMQAQAKD